MKFNAKRITPSTKSTVGKVYQIKIVNDTVWYTNDNGYKVPSFKTDWELIEQIPE